MNKPDPSSAAFFEAKYCAAEGADPWEFATNGYELGRYDAIVRALSGRRYARCFEPGCSIGVLTERLASICDEVRACDFSPTAVGVARRRCELLQGVEIGCKALGHDECWGDYDLVVLSEVGYYFTAAAWAELVDGMVAGMKAGTVVLACHWLGRSDDHTQTGEAVHAQLRDRLLASTLAERHEGFLLEIWHMT